MAVHGTAGARQAKAIMALNEQLTATTTAAGAAQSTTTYGSTKASKDIWGAGGHVFFAPADGRVGRALDRQSSSSLASVASPLVLRLRDTPLLACIAKIMRKLRNNSECKCNHAAQSPAEALRQHRGSFAATNAWSGPRPGGLTPLRLRDS
jgi:hypothetical protein